ncbi:MAG: hypothetical protein Q8P67_25855 [archaeon]|nr:hypothetical protein [archaeon]
MASYLDVFGGSSGGGNSEAAHREFPTTAEAFPAFLKKHYALIHPPLKSQAGDSFECVICGVEEKTAADCSLARKCAASNYPCDGLPCQCKPSSFSICFQCLASTLWSGTSSILLGQKRFRAKCPFCKASFCHLDVVHYFAKPLVSPPSSSTSKKRGRRRH